MAGGGGGLCFTVISGISLSEFVNVIFDLALVELFLLDSLPCSSLYRSAIKQYASDIGMVRVAFVQTFCSRFSFAIGVAKEEVGA